MWVSSYTEPTWVFMIIFPRMHVLMIVDSDPPLACMLITLRPQLEEMLWSMYVAIDSLSNYCRLHSLLQLICPCMSPTSIAVFILSMLLSQIVELVTYIIYCTVGINTGLHVIRSAVSSLMMAPWSSCSNILLHQHSVLHVPTTVTGYALVNTELMLYSVIL